MTDLIKFFEVGEATVWGNSYTHIHGPTMDKIAADCYTPPELLTVMEKLRSRPEGRYVLLNALGAFEYYGPNRNGDAFPEWSLRSLAMPEATTAAILPIIKKKIPLFYAPNTTEYGYKSFPIYAHVYRGHVNKDPLISCGDVIASAYNDKMHRVELIVFVYKDRAPDVVEKIDANQPVAWSMGAKLRFDVCSVCMNVALSRPEYCTHLAQQLNQILPDGRKVFSYNYYPRFFDISEVRAPADRSAWSLKKVASADTLELPAKKAAMEKREDALKGESLGTTPVNPKLFPFLRDTVKADMDCAPDLDPQMMRNVSNQYGVEAVLKALIASGILLKPSELDVVTGNDPAKVPNNLDLGRSDRTLMVMLKSAAANRSLFTPYLTKRALRRQWNPTATKKQEKCTLAHQKYAKLLQRIDLQKLSSTVDSDAVVLTGSTGDILNALYKTGSEEVPRWLPFVVGIALYSEQLSE
jgi:hypothetical protein